MNPHGEVPVTEAAELAARQLTLLVTTGHRHIGLCFVQVAAGPPRVLCQQWATLRVERQEYHLGVTFGDTFRPAVVLTRVCGEHGEALRHEPGLVALMAVDCPPNLIGLPASAVYRAGVPGRCRWIDCPEVPLTGYFCDPHRRWHVQRLRRQLMRAERDNTGAS